MHDEVELAKRQTSHKKGRWEAKLDRIHQSLENFTPEVKPGNQTALGTRASPFGVYIARMHRKIHELWGFGFLADLDGKSASNPMNDKKLEVTLEIVINADGTVDKTTIVKPSGVLTFDVAAIDAVESAGPYEETPKEIRSPNGKVYMHWAFHRDERQCTPYFADPFILDNAPPPGTDGAKSGLPEPSEEIARRKHEKLQRAPGSPDQSGAVMPHVSAPMGDAKATAQANAQAPNPDDPAAQDCALRWANAWENGDVDAMVAASATPFNSAGTVVADDAGKLATVWHNILGEVPARRIKEWKLLSAGGYRAVFGHLPKGEDVDGVSRLYLAVRVGNDWLTMDVTRAADGKYHVTGMSR
jgi:TonB family protein